MVRSPLGHVICTLKQGGFMPCTTILIGKKASYDGSTIVARNEDSPNGQFVPKRLTVVHPTQQPRT